MKPKFERHFAGKDNAGLRKLIRETANDVMPACGPQLERLIVAVVTNRVALTAQGQAALLAAAADYRSVSQDYNPRCDCAACMAGSLQYLGAGGRS